MQTEATLKGELGWLRMIFRSVAITRTPTSRKGAGRPVIVISSPSVVVAHELQPQINVNRSGLLRDYVAPIEWALAV